MNELTINLNWRGPALVIEVGGDIGMAAAETLQMALTPVVARHPAITVFDLSRVTLLASVAIGAIMAYHGGIKLRGGQTRIVATSGNVRNSLTRSRIDAIIPLYESVDNAIG